MKDTKDVVVAFVDTGLFIHVARRMADEFKKVYYINPSWETAFPKIRDGVVGDGYPEIQWVESLWDVVDKIDLAIFPDIGFASLQVELVRRGIKVWGCRHADGLEARRGLFLKTLEKTGLPLPKYEKITGLDNLRNFLKNEGDVYIKTSTWRGDFETVHFRSMDEDQQLLDDYGRKLGPLRDMVNFFVVYKIDSKIEDGCDTHRAGGEWPSLVMHAQENKDKSLLATFCPFQDLPEPVRKVNEEFGPILDKYGYCGPFSTEVRITDNKDGYFIDPTCRYGSPPSQLQCEMIGNLGEIAWKGANGICIDPEPADQFGVQAVFCFKREGWNIFKLDQIVEPHTKIGFSCMVNGSVCVPPDHDDPEGVGWLCATGSTIEYAIHNLKKYAEMLPSGIEVRTDSLAGLIIEAEEAGKQGMEFAKNIPEPSIVIDS